MSKNYLYAEDLYDFFVEHGKSFSYNSNGNEDDELVIFTLGSIRYDDTIDDKHKEGLLPVHLQACHIDKNLNKSEISKNNMEENMPSFFERPILGYIHKVGDQYEFYSHNMHQSEDGETIYDEIPVGHIPSTSELKLVYDKDKDKTYLEADGYIYEEYTKAADIIKREQECPVSVEIVIRSMSYDVTNKALNIEDFYLSGVTLLGKDPNGKAVAPGMEGANLKLSSFNKNDDNFENIYNELSDMHKKLDYILSHVDNNIEKCEEGGNEDNMTKFEELLQKYNKTIDDVTFEYADLTDEELEVKFAEAFENTDDQNDNSTTEEGSNFEECSEELGLDENENTSSTVSEHFENIVRTYEISHEDVRYALYNLLASYEESDNEWYYIENVYDEYFVYSNWDGDKLYRQNYIKDDDAVSFDGERIELFKEYLTASEKAELESMRANYSSIQERLSVYEEKEQKVKKEELIASKDYEAIRNSAEFAELTKDIEKYSFDELASKCDSMLLAFAKAGGKFTFAEDPDNKHHNRVGYSEPDNEYLPYGGILE